MKIIPPLRTALKIRGNSFSAAPINSPMRCLFSIFLALFVGFAPFLATETRGQGPGGPSGKGDSGKPAPPPLVMVTSVVEREVNPPQEFIGRIEAIQSVDLHAQVSGYLEKVVFTEGDPVEAGKLLYQIEQAPYRAVVKANRARVAQARATHTLDLQYLKRLKSVDTGGVSATDMESAESEAARALAALQEAEATLLQSEINLGYASIKAPITGVIGKNDFTKGNLVGPDSGALARIVQIHPIRAVFSISETALPQMQKKRLSSTSDPLREDGIFKIRFPNGEIYPLTGRLAFLDNEVDPKTGTLALRAEFENPDGFLVPGQYVTVLAKMSASKKTPVVSQSAVLEDREGRYVFVVGSDQKVQERRIETGEMQGTVWAVKRGLTAGETVVVQGVQKIRQGQKVKAVSMTSGQKEGSK